jgi:protein phosphatase
MGTTLTAMALVGGAGGRDVLALANVGDSRAYVFSEGELTQVTADHSLAEERMRHGEMSEQEAAVHPQRHILTRALGVSSDVETDMWELELGTGDRVLICSDGLSNEVGTDEMATVLRTVADPREAAQRLVDVANEHGGADNITVVIVDVQVGAGGAPSAAKVIPLGFGAAAAVAAEVSTAAVPAVPPASGEEDSGGQSGTDPAGSLGSTASTAERPGARMDDTLAPGSQLLFGGEPTTLAESGPRSDEFLLGTTSVPVARATTRVPPTPSPRADVPEEESWGARRRRMGIPRRITPRVVGFVLLVAAVPVAAYFVLRWYAYDNWFVTAQGNQIVVKQGQQGGVLWFHPKIVDRTAFTVSQITPAAVAPVRAGVQEPSLSAARSYIQTITATTTTTTNTTTTTAPFGQSKQQPPFHATTTTAPTTASTAAQ